MKWRGEDDQSPRLIMSEAGEFELGIEAINKNYKQSLSVTLQ